MKNTFYYDIINIVKIKVGDTIKTNKRNRRIRTKIFKFILLILIALLSGFTSYYVSNYMYQKSRPTKSTTLAVTYDDSKFLEIEQIVVVTEDDTLNSIYPYHMKIVNNGEIEVLFQLILEDELVSRKNISFNINDGKNYNKNIQLSDIKNNIIYEGSINPGEDNARDFYIKCYSTEDIEMNYKGRIIVKAIEIGGPGF